MVPHRVHFWTRMRVPVAMLVPMSCQVCRQRFPRRNMTDPAVITRITVTINAFMTTSDEVLRAVFTQRGKTLFHTLVD